MPKRNDKKAKAKKETSSTKNMKIEAAESDEVMSSFNVEIANLAEAIQRCTIGICPTLSHEEISSIAEAIVEMGEDVNQTLCDYLDISSKDAYQIMKDAIRIQNGDDSDQESVDSDLSDEENASDDDTSIGSTDSNDAYIQEGECELCERVMKLTAHHLIPKCTWKLIKPRFMEAADDFQEGRYDQVINILHLGEELPYGLTKKTFQSGLNIKQFLAHYTADLCRPCHSVVHKHHSNLELAEKYNTVEKILTDENIYKFCKWQSKQKPGKYGLKNR